MKLIILEETIYVKEAEYQKVKKMLNKKDDYFTKDEFKKYFTKKHDM